MLLEVTLEVFKQSKKITSTDDDMYIQNIINTSKHICNSITNDKPYAELSEKGKELYNSILFHYASRMYDDRELYNDGKDIPSRTIEHLKTLLLLECSKPIGSEV